MFGKKASAVQDFFLNRVSATLTIFLWRYPIGFKDTCGLRVQPEYTIEFNKHMLCSVLIEGSGIGSHTSTKSTDLCSPYLCLAGVAKRDGFVQGHIHEVVQQRVNPHFIVAGIFSANVLVSLVGTSEVCRCDLAS